MISYYNKRESLNLDFNVLRADCTDGNIWYIDGFSFAESYRGVESVLVARHIKFERLWSWGRFIVNKWAWALSKERLCYFENQMWNISANKVQLGFLPFSPITQMVKLTKCICLLVVLLILNPCPKTTLCSFLIGLSFFTPNTKLVLF